MRGNGIPGGNLTASRNPDAYPHHHSCTIAGRSGGSHKRIVVSDGRNDDRRTGSGTAIAAPGVIVFGYGQLQRLKVGILRCSGEQ